MILQLFQEPHGKNPNQDLLGPGDKSLDLKEEALYDNRDEDIKISSHGITITIPQGPYE